MASRTTRVGSSNGNERFDQILDLLNQQSARMNDLEQEVQRVREVRQEAPRVEEQPDNQARIEEELAKDLKRIAPPKFDGKTIGDGVEAWVIEMEKYFGLHNMSNETKVVWVAYQLSGEAATWWENEKSERKLQPREITWDLFLQSFKKRWLPQLFFDKKMIEFQNLTQGSMSITQYWEKFTNLLKYVPQYQMDERFCIQKFILGLRTDIGAEVDIHNPLTVEEVFEKATKQEQKLQQLGNL
ncbi:uncharacterized protein LOC131036985 [Cryptomeria japonica]|uniref:uncharacterized protein LOC131036985 n=1 Tax=Cryptomeria japonica TaxID=3369 RepID=UPI0027D9D167|nr:uncharacterized protein LOC131036985 [Cryptomeria japonica]